MNRLTTEGRDMIPLISAYMDNPIDKSNMRAISTAFHRKAMEPSVNDKNFCLIDRIIGSTLMLIKINNDVSMLDPVFSSILKDNLLSAEQVITLYKKYPDLNRYKFIDTISTIYHNNSEEEGGLKPTLQQLIVFLIFLMDNYPLESQVTVDVWAKRIQIDVNDSDEIINKKIRQKLMPALDDTKEIDSWDKISLLLRFIERNYSNVVIV